MAATAEAGWVGVDLFFALSGFLITGILLDTRGRAGCLRSFYVRRALRIFPLYYAVLLLLVGVAPAALGSTGAFEGSLRNLGSLQEQQGWFWSYAQNYLFAFDGGWPASAYLTHTWSLAVEEQFYLVWPPVVLILGRRGAAAFCFATLLICPFVRWAHLCCDDDVISIYVSTHCRIDSLCAGGLGAALLRGGRRRPVVRWAGFASLLGAVATLVAASLTPILQYDDPGTQPIKYSLLAVTFSALVVWGAGVPPGSVSGKLLGAWWLTLPGKYSYAIYLIHIPVRSALNGVDLGSFGDAYRPYVIFVACSTSSFCFALGSMALLERPFLRLKRFFPRPADLSELQGDGKSGPQKVEASD